MSGIRTTLEIARRALNAQQVALNVTGNNIANANTEGYNRRRVVMQSDALTNISRLMQANGVSVDRIERVRDRYVDYQLREQQQTLSYWESLQGNYSRMESIFNEPNDSGLADVMSSFFDSWQELANNPTSLTARDLILQKGQALVKKFHQLATQMSDLQDNTRTEFTDSVDKFNSLTAELAEINVKLPLAKEPAPDLLDKRDQLLREVNEMADIRVIEKDNGQVMLSLNGKVFLNGDERVAMLTPDLDDELSSIRWSDGGGPTSLSNGRLSALAEFHDQIIPSYKDKIDALASGLVQSVNEIHRAGYGLDGSTGIDFFDADGTSAEDIAIDSRVLSNIQQIAASKDGTGDNGEIGRAISRLVQDNRIMDQSLSFHDYYAGIVASIGESVQQASVKKDGQQLFVDQIKAHQESVSGVSLDEEMTNLIKYQRAYQAAAKVVNITDELMETVINLT